MASEAPPRAAGSRLSGLTLVLAGLVLLAGLLLGAWAFWRSDAGLRWALGHVPGLTFSGLQGRPDGGPFQAEQLSWQSGGLRVRVEGLAWRDLDWHWRPYPGAWLRVELISPRARRIEVKTAPSPDDAAAPPAQPHDLRLPLELMVSDLEVGTIAIDDLAPIQELGADLHLGAEAGSVHRIGRFGLRFDPLRIQGKAEVATGGDLATSAEVRVATLPGAALPWQSHIEVGGTVAQPSLDATLQTEDDAKLHAQATLAPFAAWPLLALEASTQGLDLARLADGLPTTGLSGRVVVSGGGADRPVQAELSIDNARPGEWSDGRLPVRRVEATVRGRLSERRTVEIPALRVQLEGSAEAGRLAGSGRWQGDALALELTLDALRPARLDGRAAPMSLSGPLTLSLTGLPSPDPSGAPGAAASAGAPASAPASPASSSASAPPSSSAAPRAPGLAGRVHAELDGTLLQPSKRPVQIRTDATFDAPPGGALRIALEKLELAAGPTRASLTATAQRDAGKTWQLETAGRFDRFDPAAWVPGPKNSAWRRGPHRLNGSWSADLAVPEASFSAAPTALLEALRGRARLDLQKSRLAGVALDGHAALEAGADATRLESTLDVAGNHVALEGRTGVRGRPDRWTADLRAPALGALAPLADLVPGAGAWMPTAGTLDLKASAEGSWPSLATQGELHAANVRSSRWQLGRADARWQASTGSADAPLALTLTAADLASGEQRVDRLQATLDGSLRRHRFELTASSPVRPPAWTTAAPKAPQTPRGTQLRLAAAGGWQPGSGTGGTWSGRLGELRIAPRSGAAAPWVAAQDLDLQLRLGPQGGLAEAALQPGRMELLGNTLRWSQARYQAAPAPGRAPRMALQAQLEPVEVAPWLNRLQPDFRWNGDLRIGADIEVRSAERLDAEVVVQRAGGDLSLTDEASTRSFGLSDLRLALSAHGGTWHITEAVAGTGIGVLSGAQTLRVAAGAFPAAQTPLEGVLELRVPQVGTWNPWLPVGWRIGGSLHASASFGGTLGAPQYRGRVEGSDLSVRNLFQGVDLRDGTLAAALNGTDARLERLVFSGGGEGELRMTGTASFGATPRADLQVSADHFVALGRVDRRIVVSGQADVGLQAQQVAVKGRFVVDEGVIDVSQSDAPHLDSDVVVVNRRIDLESPAQRAARATPVAQRSSDDAAAGPAPAAASPFRNTDVSILIGLGDDLRLRGHGLDTLLKGQLRITTPNGQLAVNGTVRTVSGTFKAYGQNLAIERGVIVFNGDVSTPRLDILAVRPDIDTRVGVTVQGSAANPRIRLYSEPEMSEMDKLSWLVLGRAPSGLGSNDTALLQRAAMALLAGEGGGQDEGVLKKLGLDELSVSGVGSGDLSNAVVTVGKQLSKRLFVGYERGINSAAGSWNLIYRIARRFTLRAKGGSENALDAIWTWRWD